MGTDNLTVSCPKQLIPDIAAAVEDDSAAKPLDMEALWCLYDLTDWRVVLVDGMVDREYGSGEHKLSTVSLFKALALPYVINIPTERALGRELLEKEPLQQLCGFTPGLVPSRETIWHFRNKYIEVYPEIMLRVLISMVLGTKEPNYALPFVRRISESKSSPEGLYHIFRISEYQAEIEVWRTPDMTLEGDFHDSPKDSAEYWQRRKIQVTQKTEDCTELARRIEKIEVERQEHYRSKQPRRGFVGELGLPVEVRTKLYDQQPVRFEIVKPSWVSTYHKVMDTVTGLDSTSEAIQQPYAVCNVLVVREIEGHQQVLLSRRLSGYGQGTYALPGGRRLPRESLQDCARRELWQETRMRLVASRPISWYNFRLPGKPPVQVVGALAEEYENEPQLVEPNHNTDWEWFNIVQLPRPLFKPTKVAIDHYIKGTYNHLQWDDIEAQVPETWELGHQLRLL